MKSNKYWEQRANERMASYHKGSDKVIGQINRGYEKAIKDINTDIDSIFYNYVKNHDLTPDEAQKILNSPISNAELEKIRAKINDIQDPKIKKRLLAQLNAKAYNARMTRLEALKESALINSKVIADTELAKSTLGYIDSINQAYYQNIFDIQKGTGLAFEFASIPVNTVEEILKNNWSGKHYSERIWHNSDVLAEKLQETITSGLMSGKSYRRMARELEELSDYGKFATERLIRTETTYVTNASEMESYKECEIERYIYVATLDLRTSDICREHDGNIYEVSKSDAGKNCPPLHAHCRSTTRAYFEGMERLQRRARDPETGKTYIIPGNMNYNEWYQEYVVKKHGPQKAEYFEKAIQNKSSDKEQFKSYKTTLAEDLPVKSFEDFQKLKYNNVEEYGILKAQMKGMTYYKQAVENEPAITEHIKTVSEKTGMSVEGLQYRLKTKESYLGKIRREYKPGDNAYEVKDIIRYTYTATPNELTDKTLNAIDSHRSMGYNTTGIKNYWLNKNNPYKGINTTVQHPNGQKFEVQYHTPESFAIKNGEMHRLYEKWRVLPKDSDKRSEIETEMKKLSDSIIPPNNIERVK